MLSLCFLYVCLLKHTNMHQTCSIFCGWYNCYITSPSLIVIYSADLEITVQLLVQIDKLVQLIESPVFTCELQALPYKRMRH